MICYLSPSRDPAWNLALEEYFFETTPPGETCLMLWQNHNTVVIGKNQNTMAEIDNEYVHSCGIRVVRRLSGGGAVYHDDGNLNFTFITDAPEGGLIDLHRFCQPVAEALRSFGVPVEIGGRNDMTVEGKKFSGNAQYIRRGRVMHHGTLMFDSDLTVLQKALRVDREKIASKGILSVASRVTNLRPWFPENVTMEQFARRLMEAISGQENPPMRELSREDMEAIRHLKETRYDTWEWNYGRSPVCTVTNSRRIEGCGRIRLELRLEEGRIRDLRITGDFFGNRDVEELAGILEGCAFRREAVLERLSGAKLEEYIHNVTAEDLIGVLMA